MLSHFSDNIFSSFKKFLVKGGRLRENIIQDRAKTFLVQRKVRLTEIHPFRLLKNKAFFLNTN